MAAILGNLRTTVHISIALAVILLLAFIFTTDAAFDQRFWGVVTRWAHVVSGVMWIGLLWYFNFVQIPTMPSIPDEQKPAISKHIAPKALFWFRWAAAATVLTGLILAWLNGYIVDALALGATAGFAVPGHIFIGIGMWLALIMAFNVWFVIWPNQQIALGLVEREGADKAKSAKTAMLFSRTNTLLSLPMLVAMAGAQSLFGIS
ncbi:MAG: urate hydroxylase PuuD [Maricaulaceae bacterium]|nr:urate hydroxylase PuuD [Maricaulaceae bacterium]